MTNMPQLTQGTFNKEENKWEEEWKVITSSKGNYFLSKKQAIILKQAMAIGNRSTIMFQTFAIAIPYVVEFYRTRRYLKDAKQLSARATEEEYKPMDPEVFKKWKKEIYGKIGKPMK